MSASASESAMSFDTNRMKLSQVQNREFHTHSLRIYNEIKTLGLTTVQEREQEYVRRMNALPSHIQYIEVNSQHKVPKKSHTSSNTFHVSSTSRMKPPHIVFEDEVDITEYYEGSNITQDNQVRYVNFFKGVKNASSV